MSKKRNRRPYRTEVPLPKPLPAPTEPGLGPALHALADLLRFVADRLVEIARRLS
jgi:hypothetical protein